MRTNHQWISINHINSYGINKASVYMIISKARKNNSSSVFVNNSSKPITVNIQYLLLAQQNQINTIKHAHNLFYRITSIINHNKFVIYLTANSERTKFSWNRFTYDTLFSSSLGMPNSLLIYTIPTMVTEFINLAEQYLNNITSKDEQ